jgi:hypothetical protein
MRLFLLSILLPALFGQDRTVDLLRQLADAAGPSGFEEPFGDGLRDAAVCGVDSV